MLPLLVALTLTAAPKPVELAKNASSPKIAWDREGYLVLWLQHAGSKPEANCVGAARLGTDGALLSATDKLFCTEGDQVGMPAIASSGERAVVGWSELHRICTGVVGTDLKLPRPSCFKEEGFAFDFALGFDGDRFIATWKGQPGARFVRLSAQGKLVDDGSQVLLNDWQLERMRFACRSEECLALFEDFLGNSQTSLAFERIVDGGIAERGGVSGQSFDLALTTAPDGGFLAFIGPYDRIATYPVPGRDGANGALIYTSQYGERVRDLVAATNDYASVAAWVSSDDLGTAPMIAKVLVAPTSGKPKGVLSVSNEFAPDVAAGGDGNFVVVTEQRNSKGEASIVARPIKAH